MKIALSTLIVAQAFSCAFSQPIKSFGVKFGIAAANQHWSDKSSGLKMERGYRTGLYGAGTVDFLDSEHIHIASELGYCEKGFYESMELHSQSSTIPIVMQTQVSYLFLNNAIKFKYQAGGWIPYALLGFRVDRQISYDTYNDPNDFHEWIFGLTGALGIEYKVRRFGVFCELQYLHDLTKLVDTKSTYDTKGSQLTNGLSITNKAYVMNLGLRYYLVKNGGAVSKEK